MLFLGRRGAGGWTGRSRMSALTDELAFEKMRCSKCAAPIAAIHNLRDGTFAVWCVNDHREVSHIRPPLWGWLLPSWRIRRALWQELGI